MVSRLNSVTANGWGWYSKIPIQLFMAFPHAVDLASDTWVDRIIATTVIACLLADKRYRPSCRLL